MRFMIQDSIIQNARNHAEKSVADDDSLHLASCISNVGPAGSCERIPFKPIQSHFGPKNGNILANSGRAGRRPYSQISNAST